MTDVADAVAAALPLIAEVGRAAPREAVLLTGGRNNRVVKLLFEDASPLVLKSYFHDPNDPRDRLGAEFAFLETVWGYGVRNVPQPLACDRARHLGLYSFVQGEKIVPGQLRADHVQAALDFVVAINRQTPDLTGLKPASEACFSIGSHMQTVAARVARLDQLDETVPLAAAAGELIETSLKPLWHQVASEVGKALETGRVADSVSGEIVSPSDFGFHNALAGRDGVTFIDFEYAGIDDPAKLVCDFFCQPDIPVDIRFLDHFVSVMSQSLNLNEGFLERTNLLLSAYRIKWVCIMLNEFADIGSRRRLFAGGQEKREARCRLQIEKASRSLSVLQEGLR